METTFYQGLEIRACRESDLDELMHLQEIVCKGIKDQNIFVSTSREENSRYLHKPNIILGVFSEKRLIAYCSIAFPGTDSDNLGWDLGWLSEQVKNCAKLDTVLVEPSFRGRGLQRVLIHKAIEKAQNDLVNGSILTTVSPQNSHSLQNMQTEGFQILLKTEKYGGRERFILGKQFGVEM
jgi:GNAT superfamily N-acetyltransferase